MPDHYLNGRTKIREIDERECQNTPYSQKERKKAKKRLTLEEKGEGNCGTHSHFRGGRVRNREKPQQKNGLMSGNGS